MRIRVGRLRSLVREALWLRQALLNEENALGNDEKDVTGQDKQVDSNSLYADYRPTDNYRPTNNYRPEDNYRPDANAYLGVSTPIFPEDNYRPTDASSYIGMTRSKTDDEVAAPQDELSDEETITTASTSTDIEDKDVDDDETDETSTGSLEHDDEGDEEYRIDN